MTFVRNQLGSSILQLILTSPWIVRDSVNPAWSLRRRRIDLTRVIHRTRFYVIGFLFASIICDLSRSGAFIELPQ